MANLIYPYDTAPMVPTPTADTCFEHETSGEYVPVVEPNGLVIGMADRKYCHSGSKVLHPVVHLHIIDRYSRIYLQKRSMQKDIQPGKWDTSVGGHVAYGETLIEALYREANEELYFSEFNPLFLNSYEFESEVEKELIHIYATIGSQQLKLKPDPAEIEEGRWWHIDEIDKAIGTGVLTPNFENEYKMIRNSLLALL